MCERIGYIGKRIFEHRYVKGPSDIIVEDKTFTGINDWLRSSGLDDNAIFGASTTEMFW